MFFSNDHFSLGISLCTASVEAQPSSLGLRDVQLQNQTPRQFSHMRLLAIFFLCLSSLAAQAQTKPKMTYMGAYDSGQAGVSIHKLFDPTEEVVCYLLMPDQAGRREGASGGWIYEGNTVGAMSCVKARMQVIPVATSPATAASAPAKGKK